MGRHKKTKLGILRSLISVVILTAFVLGISLLVKTIATADPTKALALINPVLARMHINGEQVGTVAGKFVERINQTGLSGSGSITNQSSQTSQTDKKTQETLFQVAVMADVHGSNDNLTKALELAKQASVANVFFLGDYTDYGEVSNLTDAKKIMDAGGLSYNSLPGDHDLADSVGPANYLQVFGSGSNYFVKIINGIKFVGFDNSANYTLISEDRMAWFKNEVADADFVLLAQPVYHSSSLNMMGIINGQVTENVRAQAVEIQKIIEDSKVEAVIAGDLHQSSISDDPERPELKHIVVGALADERNLQTPRFTMLTVYKNGSFDVKDVLVQ